MDCAVIYHCDCNNRNYASKNALNQHRKTQMHKTWMERNELRHLKMQLTQKTNEVHALEHKLRLLQDLNTQLLHRLALDVHN